jgi:phage terminase large subunit-like protein
VEKGGTRGKRTRAEPVAALYEQGRVHHVGLHSKLEDEFCTFMVDTKKSPNALDAAVYALGEILVQAEEPGFSFA